MLSTFFPELEMSSVKGHVRGPPAAHHPSDFEKICSGESVCGTVLQGLNWRALAFPLTEHLRSVL